MKEYLLEEMCEMVDKAKLYKEEEKKAEETKQKNWVIKLEAK